MTTAKIAFEMDSDVLAKAQAFAARNRIPLNKLVVSYLASLGKGELDTVPAAGPLATLLDVSTGKLGVTDAARKLGLVDAGHVLALMRQNQIPLALGGLPEHFVQAQSGETLEALRSCMLPPPRVASVEKTRGSKAAE